MTERALTDRIAIGVPVDRTAARVTGRGVHYKPQMRAHATEALIGMPPILRPTKAGKQMGRWTILGLAQDSPTGSAKRPDALFVVKCMCGLYALRGRKALHRADQRGEGCPECKHVQHVKKQYNRHRHD